MRQTEQPTITRGTRAGDPTEEFEHPAFGIATLTVANGGPTKLFGSDINHETRVRMVIKRSRLKRSLSNDWFGAFGESLIELEMSHAQFAEWITSSYRGNGVPCTLTRVNGAILPSIAMTESREETAHREVADAARRRLDKMQAELTRMSDVIKSGKITKSNMSDILVSLQRELTSLPGSLSYVLGQAGEAIEKATSHAKIEVEAYFNSRLKEMGLNAAIADPNQTAPSIKFEPAPDPDQAT